MTWKFSSCERPELDPTGYNTENIEEISYDQLKTTYQNDYTGIPQGVHFLILSLFIAIFLFIAYIFIDILLFFIDFNKVQFYPYFFVF